MTNEVPMMLPNATQNNISRLLTHSYGCNHRRDDHRERHTSSYHQVPLVFGAVLALIAVKDLRRDCCLPENECIEKKANAASPAFDEALAFLPT